MPKISILTPCYNHEKYISAYLQSVLNQTFNDFELIIVDDYSSDQSVKEVEKFKDNRIKLIKHLYNKGINATLNTAFKNSSGDCIVFMASDDMFEVNALEKINEVFENNQNIDVVYPALKYINEDNQIFKNRKITNVSNEIDLIRDFFIIGNCLTSPGMSIKRKTYDKIYPLDNAFCNQQDTLMHIKLLLNKAKIFILDDYLVRYRVATTNASISAGMSSNIARANLEMEILMQEFLKMNDLDLLEKIFAKEIQATSIKPYKETLKFFLGYMALQSDDEFKKYWGYHKIMEYYNIPSNVEILKEKYNFTFKDYVKLSSFCINGRLEKKFKKYKKRFIIACISSFIIFVILCGVIIYQNFIQ
ncbi:glycosyltransferase [Campylobacter coli]|nr:glycosyltransferase [Campylobacter coli]HEF2146173.1 glycosyltransferase [Campylobacter coli]